MRFKVFTVFSRIMARLEPCQRKQLWMLVGASVFVALCEMGGVVVIALFASTLANPESMMASSHIATAQQVLGWAFLGEARGLVLALLVGVVVVAALKALLSGSFRYCCSWFSTSVGTHVNKLLLTGTMGMPYAYVAARNPADLVTHVSWGSGAGAFIEQIVLFFSDVALLGILAVPLIVVDPFLVGGGFLVVASLSFVLMFWVKRRLDTAARNVMLCRRASNRHSYKAVVGFREVKISGREALFVSDYANEIKQLPPLMANLTVLQSLPGWTLEVAGFLLLCCSAWGMLVLAGYSFAKTMAVLTIIALVAWRGVPAVIRIITELNSLRRLCPQLEIVLTCLNEFSSVETGDAKVSEKEAPALLFNEAIECRGLSFSYDESVEALKNVSFTIHKGEAIGIVGRSGGGKSTLADVLIGLQSPTKGDILVDGRKLEGPVWKEWMHRVGYVSQAPFIFDGTLAQNVAMCGNGETADPDRLAMSCERAAVNEFMASLPDGYETLLGDRGVRLSGGQRQRICIARALYDEPDILIFDEATSALDSKNEKNIQDMVFSLKGQITMVIIAHRLSTVTECDKIIWLEDGKVRMVGEPGEVLPQYTEAGENNDI